MGFLAQLDAAVLGRILSSLSQRQALALTILAQDWLQLVCTRLWRLVVSPDLSPGLAQTAARHCIRLREVVFQSSQAEDAKGFWAHAAAIWRLLATPAPMRQLIVRGSGEDIKRAAVFLAELQQAAGNCKNLQIFHVEHFSAADDGAMQLLLKFCAVLHLTSLRLRNCSLKASACGVMCNELQASPVLGTLSQLDLCQNNLSEEGAAALAGLLPSIPELHDLSLSGNGLGPAGLAALVHGLPASLTHLDLSLNGLGTVGLAVLLEANLQSLVSLNVRANWLGSSDIDVLPRLLQSMRSLASLDIALLGCFQHASASYRAMWAMCRRMPRFVGVRSLSRVGLASSIRSLALRHDDVRRSLLLELSPPRF